MSDLLDAPADVPKRVLDPSERTAEVLFGLIMVLTFGIDDHLCGPSGFPVRDEVARHAQENDLGLRNQPLRFWRGFQRRCTVPQTRRTTAMHPSRP